MRHFGGYQLTPEWSLIMDGLRSQNPIDALNQIGDRIMLEDPHVALKLPFDDICSCINNILENSTTIQLTEATTFCIRKLSETLENAEQLFSKTNILQLMRDKMVNNVSKNTNENCLYSFHAISKSRPEELGHAIGIIPFISRINDFPVLEQKIAFKAMTNITERFVSDQMSRHLTKIAKFFTHHDQTLVSYAIKTFKNIASVVNRASISPKVISRVAVSLLVVTDITSVLNLLDVLIVLMDQRRLVQNLIDSAIDFICILDQTQVGNRTMDLYEKVVKLINIVLKQSTSKKAGWRPNNLDNFISKTLTVTSEFIKEHKGFSNTVLDNLAMIVKVKPKLDISELYSCLASYALDNALAPIVLKIACRVSNKQSLVKSPIPKMMLKLKEKIGSPKFSHKVDELMNSLGKDSNISFSEIKEVKSFDELYETLITKQTLLLDFVNSNGIEASVAFLKNYSGELDDKKEEVLNKLIEASHEMLVGFPIKHEEDPLKSERDEKMDHKSISVELLYNGIKDKFRVEISIDFAAIENWFNKNAIGISFHVMKMAIDNNPITHGLLSLQDQEFIPESKLACLNRIAGTPGYKKFKFKIGDRFFSWRDGVFKSLCSVYGKQEDLTTMRPVIELVEGDIPRSDNVIKKVVPETIKPVLELLEQIKRIAPKLSTECKEFSAHLSQSLASIVLTHGGYSTASSLIYHYPFVFSFADRLLYFKESALDFSSGVYAMFRRFVKPDDRRSSVQIKYICSVSREKIYEEGSLVINSFAQNLGLLEVSFTGETGIGIGPTQEFYTMFSHEMCRNSLKMWRTEKDTEFAFSEGGLYPLPTAKKSDLYTLGVFCAKALATGFLSDIPFSPMFIKILRKEKVEVQEVDQNYAKALSNPDGLIGLDFSYPGLPDFPLCEGGLEKEITRENVDEYIELVKDFTCGQRMIDLCQNFVNGFNEVIPFSSTKIFEPEEFINLLSGSGKRITLEELNDNVSVGAGYEKNSAQIKYLFETITELSDEDFGLFVKFLTGTNRLPVGGIASLQPKLTIAVRMPIGSETSDSTLPSVSTCFNYLKLPMYSSKEILKERLLTAIRECQGSFDLS